MPHDGHGLCKYPSGDVFAGQWRYGRRDGRGALVGTSTAATGITGANSSSDNNTTMTTMPAAAAAAAAATAASVASAATPAAGGGMSYEGEFDDGRIATAHGSEGRLRFG